MSTNYYNIRVIECRYNLTSQESTVLPHTSDNNIFSVTNGVAKVFDNFFHNYGYWDTFTVENTSKDYPRIVTNLGNSFGIYNPTWYWSAWNQYTDPEIDLTIFCQELCDSLNIGINRYIANTSVYRWITQVRNDYSVILIKWRYTDSDHWYFFPYCHLGQEPVNYDFTITSTAT